MKHLTDYIIINYLSHNLEPAEETAAFEHWSLCQSCQARLLSSLEHKTPWSSDLTADTQLFFKRIGARWPFWLIGTSDTLLALTFSESECREYTIYLRRQGFAFTKESDSNVIEESGKILRDFMQTGRPFRIKALNFFLIKTPFARQVLTWTGLVPFGKTATYGQIAAWMGRPTAARGVGGALHSNPLALIIPCHRIIGAKGALVGFGGGIELKQKLLELEGSYPQI
ncbi:MAG: methylated-DNA--[protein]-cysteine S-methyltransferase [Candidatus Marinimicrobia bacterium]|nr:methylated-DNA--[protein]-cysteine S-methyltransferase [Candidatus Neomarinimicrobiota bacterium]